MKLSLGDSAPLAAIPRHENDDNGEDPFGQSDMKQPGAIPLATLDRLLDRFVQWLDGYGETSWDHQTYFASNLGRWAKALYYRNQSLGTVAVAPMILSEAFVPAARRLFGGKVRFPIADAHYAMGFAFLAQARGDRNLGQRAVHFLEELEKSRSPEYDHHCWGYPFNWETRNGTIHRDTPLITTTPYVYEAFNAVYQFDGNPDWLETMASTALHAVRDIKDYPVSETASTCSYTPFDTGGVVNASAYRGFLLTSASVDLKEERYAEIAERNVNFVLDAQRPDGSWYYSVEGARDFVDHFHTCFVLKALAKIDALRPSEKCRRAIDGGIEYYLANLLDERRLPKPFSKAPRLTVYRKELYDYAECINLCVLLRGRIPEMETVLKQVLEDLQSRWVKPDGSFRARELWLAWDNVPMHRWAQSQMFRSLSLLALAERGSDRADAERGSDRADAERGSDGVDSERGSDRAQPVS